MNDQSLDEIDEDNHFDTFLVEANEFDK